MGQNGFPHEHDDKFWWDLARYFAVSNDNPPKKKQTFMKAIKGIQRIGQCTMYKSSFLIKLHRQQRIEFLFKIASEYSSSHWNNHIVTIVWSFWVLSFVTILEGASEQRVRISPALRWGFGWNGSAHRKQTQRCWNVLRQVPYPETNWSHVGFHWQNDVHCTSSSWLIPGTHVEKICEDIGGNLKIDAKFCKQNTTPHTHRQKKSWLWIGSLMKLYETLSK